MSEGYTPIPTPFRQRLRDFRVRFLPIIVFICVAVSVVYLWDQQVYSQGYIGEVVGDSSTVSSPTRGVFVQAHFSEFDRVKKGTLLGRVIVEDTSVVNAQLDVIRQEIESIKEGLDPMLNKQRNQIDYENLRIELIDKRIALSQFMLELQTVRANFNSAERLYEQDLITDKKYELQKSQYDILKAQTEETKQFIEDLTARIQRLSNNGQFESKDQNNPVIAAIKVQENRLESLKLQLQPKAVYAPISGVVSNVYNHNGEHVEPGEPLMEIEAQEPSHIVGYIRQPFTTEPQVGMEVEVRTRGPEKKKYTSRIVQLGGHIQMIDRKLQRPGGFMGSGLPVQISMPQTNRNQFIPGEIVDIVLHQ